MYSKDWRLRNCPLCGESEFSQKPEVSSPKRAEMLSFQEVKSYFIGLRNEQVFFSYNRCQNCGLLYCPRYFSEEQLKILYSEMPDNLMGEDKATVSKTQSGYVEWLSRRVNSIESYMEIGPDIGLVAVEIQKRYEVVNSAMIEPNRSAHRALRENLLKGKLQVYEYISEVSVLEKFNLIAGIHVYDHLLEPMKDLIELRNHAQDDAELLLVVHDEKSFLRRVMKSKWPPFCLQHPQLYNSKTLGELLLRAGWRLENLSKSTNWWHLDHFAKMGSAVVGLPTSWSKVLPSIEFPTRLGNMIALARWSTAVHRPPGRF